ncbi:hypothetical protein, conserved [Trypanosoma brucei gambiense DAL972]|uniref:Uncharacterized protein n=1 Tax=Trypanosoma brucei gambiense (strain MHOM/CI/86/DAL972) TaxID=679716 RepID=C9ZHW6_TRYB9|nr:hypothetical protein, conserved [Trypanosoma brucei gambiense DAL972]CBH08837.1 hypothetical protein, conserved [Trypanosoma brucei gambiense DAL972]|eukprot:XP_011771278.1 hypothetical protein, conserved [Trypanosoma brucei gambiense DAL972]
MNRTVAICGQRSLARFKYAAVTGLLTLKVPQGALFNMLVAAIGFLEGFDAHGLSFSVDVPDGAFCKTRPIGCCYTEVSRVSSLPKLMPTEQTSASTRNRYSMNAKTCESQPSHSVENIPFRVFIDVADGPLAGEEFLYDKLKTVSCPCISMKVMAVFFAAGVTAPKEIMLPFFDRVATHDKTTAMNLASFLEYEMNISSYVRFLKSGQTKQHYPNRSKLEEIMKFAARSNCGETQIASQRGGSTRSSRLQRTRERK